MNDREQLVIEWLNAVLPTPLIRMAPASSDASFRRYFRVWHDSQTLIVMTLRRTRKIAGPLSPLPTPCAGWG